MTDPLSEREMERVVEGLDVWCDQPPLVRCEVCDFTHVSVHVVGTERVECPNCHHMTPIYPEEE